MPLYEYECTECKRHTEHIQKFSDPEITDCPTCGGVLERVISAPAISFKGGGWFADGYSHAKPGAESKNGESVPAVSATASDGGGSGSKDTTTAPAAPAPKAPAPAAAAASSSSPDKK